MAGSTIRSSTHGSGRPAERSRCSRGPSGSWSSGSSWTTPPVVSVRPYTPNSGQRKVRSAALSTGVVIGEAPYAIERRARVVAVRRPGTAHSICRMVGTKTALVTRSRSSRSRTAAASNSLTRMVGAPFQIPRNVHPMPPMWNMGSGVRLTVSPSKPHSGEESTAAERLRCVVSTPFGTPVVPDVYICRTVSPDAPRPPGSSGGCEASQRSYSAPIATTRRSCATAFASSPATAGDRAPRAGAARRRPAGWRRARRAQPPVQGHRHRSDLGGREQQLHDLGGGAVEVGDTRPGPDARGEQGLGQAVGALVELGEGQRRARRA